MINLYPSEEARPPFQALFTFTHAQFCVCPLPSIYVAEPENRANVDVERGTLITEGCC